MSFPQCPGSIGHGWTTVVIQFVVERGYDWRFRGRSVLNLDRWGVNLPASFPGHASLILGPNPDQDAKQHSRKRMFSSLGPRKKKLRRFPAVDGLAASDRWGVCAAKSGPAAMAVLCSYGKTNGWGEEPIEPMQLTADWEGCCTVPSGRSLGWRKNKLGAFKGCDWHAGRRPWEFPIQGLSWLLTSLHWGASVLRHPIPPLSDSQRCQQGIIFRKLLVWLFGTAPEFVFPCRRLQVFFLPSAEGFSCFL